MGYSTSSTSVNLSLLTIFMMLCCVVLFLLLDDWAEQKYLEGRRKRDVYDFGKPLPLEQVVLSSIWAAFTVVLFSRVFWQLVHGNTNLF
jgi:ABC-type Fe3+ transport system permease subunit